jgi:hypothetical protein
MRILSNLLHVGCDKVVAEPRLVRVFSPADVADDSQLQCAVHAVGASLVLVMRFFMALMPGHEQ